MHQRKNAGLLALAFVVAAVFSAPCRAECATGAKNAAGRFMNAYVKQILAMEHKHKKGSIGQWLHANRELTESFKKSYQDLVDSAKRDDPELGLDFDPVVDAQDFPDKGFIVESCDASGFVTVRGVGWETFKVTVKVVNASGWRVDGAGVINIPRDKQASKL